MTKRLLAVLLSCIMIFGTMPHHIVFAVEETASTWDGSVDISWYTGGSSPYTISTAEQLAGLAAIVNGNAVTDEGTTISETFSHKTIVLSRDIVLNDTSDWENWGNTSTPENEWLAIGSRDKKFEGSFDGANHTVSGIYINRNADNQGLFGYIAYGSIKNIGVVESYIHGAGKVGGIVGKLFTSSVENAYNTGSISGGMYLGGITGSMEYDSSITNVYNAGSINSINQTKANSGGIVGYCANTSYISNAYNTGSVTGLRTYVGGVVGYNIGSTISNVYSADWASLSGSGYVGDIFGGNANDTVNSGIVTESGTFSTSYEMNDGISVTSAASYTAEHSSGTALLDVLNGWVDTTDYMKWKIGDAGYPIFDSKYSVGIEVADDDGDGVTQVKPGEWVSVSAHGSLYQWQASSDGETWSDIDGETSSAYRITGPDSGQYLRASIGYTSSVSGSGSTMYSEVIEVPYTINLASATSSTVLGDDAVSFGNDAASAVRTAYIKAGEPVIITYRLDNSGTSSNMLVFSYGETVLDSVSTTTDSAVSGTFEYTADASHADENGVIGLSTVFSHINALSGTVSLDGNLKFGETLTANAVSNNSGTLSYKWWRVEEVDSETSVYLKALGTDAQYTISEGDIGYKLELEVSSDIETGSLAARSETVPKIVNTSTVKKPVLDNQTVSSITINQVDGYEYLLVLHGASMREGTWQSANTFSGLSINTNYDIYQRIKETDSVEASKVSSVLTVMEAMAPTVSSYTPLNGAVDVTTTGSIRIEFSEAMDTTSGSAVSVTSGMDIDGDGTWVSSTAYKVMYSGLDYLSSFEIALSGFKDIAGNPLSTMVYSFTTMDDPTATDPDSGSDSGTDSGSDPETNQDTIPPSIVNLSPLDGAIDVTTSGSIHFEFSEKMDTTLGSIVQGTNGMILESGIWLSNNTVYSAKYSGLDFSTTYEMSLVGYKDQAGNSLVEIPYSFTTTSAPSIEDTNSSDSNSGSSSSHSSRPSSSKSNSTDSSTSTAADSNAITNESLNAVVNGQSQSMGTVVTINSVSGLRTSTLEVKAESVLNVLSTIEKQDSKENKITLLAPVADKVSVVVLASVFQSMSDSNCSLNIASDSISYEIKTLNMASVADALGVSGDDLSDVEIEIQMETIEGQERAQMEERAIGQGYTLITEPISCKVQATRGGEEGATVEIDTFNNYVQLRIAISNDTDSSGVLTGVIYNANGTFTHVPTKVVEQDGKLYVEMFSMTNSEYAVISNSVIVPSFANHWSKAMVNNLASRLIIENASNFDPDAETTRGEFIAYLVKGLGLYRTGVAHNALFTDMTVNNADILT